MRKLLLFLAFILLPSIASAQQGLKATAFTSAVADAGIKNSGSAISFHKLTWNKTGTVTGCTVALDSSVDGITWSAGAAIAGQTCTSNGVSAIANVTANYVRMNMTAFVGTGEVTVTWTGFVSDPTPGGTGTVTNAAPLTANLPVIGAGGNAVAVGTRTGNTTQFPTWTGATTAAKCVDTDASGNLQVTAADCGAAVGTVTTSGAPVANQTAYFTGAAVITGTTTDTTVTHSLFATAGAPAYRQATLADVFAGVSPNGTFDFSAVTIFKVPSITSSTANPATTGCWLCMAKTDKILIRNNVNGANLNVAQLNSSDQVVLGDSAGVVMGSGSQGILDIPFAAAPGNPAAGLNRLFSTSTDVGCLTPAGVQCIPRLGAPNTFAAAATLDMSASTVSNALKVPAQAGLTSGADGAIAYDTTAKSTHVRTNGADSIAATFASAPAGTKCLQSNGTTGLLSEAAGTCGTTTPAFSVITSGTNSGAAMIVGTGASLTTSGTGTISTLAASTGNVANKPATTDSNFWVSTAGNDSNDGLSWGSAKLTPAAAVALCPATGCIVRVGGGAFTVSSMISLNAADIHLIGSGKGTPYAGGTTGVTTFNVAAGTTGIDMTGLCTRCEVSDIFLKSASVGAGTDDGIRVRGPGMTLSNVVTKGFGRDGIRVDSTVGPTNVNSLRMDNVESQSNFVNGFNFVATSADIQAGFFTMLDSVGNGNYGYLIAAGGNDIFMSTQATGNTVGGWDISTIGCYYFDTYVESTAVSSFVFENSASNNKVWFPQAQPTTITMNASGASNKVFYSTAFAPVETDLFIGPYPGLPTPETYRFASGFYGTSQFNLKDETANVNIFRYIPSSTTWDWLATAGVWGTALQDFSASTMKIPQAVGFTATVNSTIGLDTTNKNTHLWTNSADSIAAAFASAPTTNVIPKSVIASSNTLLANSLITDTGTQLNYTGTGGLLLNPASVSGAVVLKQGTTQSAGSNAITIQGPTAVTSYIDTLPGVAATGVITNNVSAAVITQGISGDANHSATVTIGSGTSIGSTSLCSTGNCPVGTYAVHAYLDITTACGTTGTYLVSLIYTDDQGSKTVPINLSGTGTVPATGVVTTTSTANFGQTVQMIRSTGAASINYSTTAVACGTAGPMVGKLYLAAVPIQ